MNEKPKNNNIEKRNEIIKKKTFNSNNVNKKINNKDSIRKQKRIFQMQKRHALFNEEDFPELESDNNINIKLKEEQNELNNFNFSKKLEHIDTAKKNNLSFNYNNSLKDNLSIEQIQHKKTYVIQNSKKNLENIIPEKIESEIEQQNLKEEEISLKKKNTNSNTNDEDKTSTEALFPNEYEVNRKKSKSNLHNETLGKDIFNRIINGDIDENPNIFSGSNDNNEFEDANMEKEEIEFKDNLMNNFNFNNIINDETGSKDENIENENSVIINETDQENNINENNEEDDKEDSNVELNISNLEIDINEINEEDNNQNEDDLTMLGPNSNEFAKKYLSSKSKSFIKFNNNLTARVTADSLKNSLSYMLALCPELMGGVDKKNLIKENYAATDVISEDIEAENFTPRQSEKVDESPPKKMNEENNNKNNYNKNSINTNDYLSNKTFRNKDTKGLLEISKKEKGNNSPKTHYKNRSKIDRNTFNNIHDLDNDIKNNNFTNSKKTIINTKTKPINSNINNDNNLIYTNYNTNNDKYRNSTIKNTEHVTIKCRHQKAKSLANNNNQIDSFNLNSNVIYKQHSPKQTSGIFNKKNTINKILYKNVDNRKKKTTIAKDKETEYHYNNQNYLSNDSNKKSNQKFFKKSNSNAYSNTMVKSHNYCKSDLKDKFGDIKKKFTFVRKNNAPDSSKLDNMIHNKNNAYNDISHKICFTEKSNKSKNYTSFISHLKKNTPENVNNVSEQNINHSKKLSMQITDGYKFFMNSINTNIHTNNRYNNDIKKNIKKKRIGSNNFTIKSTSISNYFSFNKNKVNNNSSNITFIKKTTTIKENKHSPIKPNHNKSKTSYIAPSYQNLNKTKNRLLKKNFTLINNNKSKKTSEISSKNIKRNYIKKINNKFNEIKKVVNDSSVKIVHKKINTIGQTNELTKLLNNNSNIGINKQLKDSSSNSNYKKNFNKHKIISALQRIKFSPMANYSKVLNELYKSKKNLFVILVYTDSIKKYIFRGLYEVNSSDQKIANKIFAPGYGQNKLNIARLNNFFNYQSNNGEFVRIKFNNESEKKFNADTIIAY